jgi:hyperosmotically inducible protein
MNKFIGTKAFVLVSALTLASGLTLVSCAETETSASTGAYIDDSVVTSKVKSAILQDEALKVMQINVKTYKGAVQLSGFVDTQQMVAQAGWVASKVNGVSTVQNDLIVKQ